MTADSETGVAITLAGESYTMTPSFQAAVAIEEQTGVSILVLARRAGEGELGLTDTAAIITAGLRASGEPAMPDKVGAMLMKDGLLSSVEPVADFLLRTVTGKRPAKTANEVNQTAKTEEAQDV